MRTIALSITSLTVALSLFSINAHAETRIPASTAYLDPDANGAKVAKEGISGWTNPRITVSWFGEIKIPGKVDASVSLRLPKDKETKLHLIAGEQSREVRAKGTGESQIVKF